MTGEPANKAASRAGSSSHANVTCGARNVSSSRPPGITAAGRHQLSRASLWTLGASSPGTHRKRPGHKQAQTRWPDGLSTDGGSPADPAETDAGRMSVMRGPVAPSRTSLDSNGRSRCCSVAGDPGPGLTGEGTPEVVRVGDERLLPATLKVGDDSLDLRAHASGREMPALREILPGFRERQVVDPALPWGTEL